MTTPNWQIIRNELLEMQDEPLTLPATEEFFAYAEGKLPPADEERVRRALVAYPELAMALATPFPEDDAKPGAVDYLSPEELDLRWRELHDRIDDSAQTANVLQFWRRSAMSIAAMLVAAFGGLIGETYFLHLARTVPRVPATSILLMPEGSRGPAVSMPETTTGGDSTLLVAPLVGGREFTGYRMELQDEEGKTRWKSAPLQLRDDDSFSILLPRAFLRPGKYKVLLYGLDGAHEEQLATYPLRVP
ncbi:MAG: hypothetical protein JOZ54_07735 [Acidobacteria bacterium]|nr:hypothetical protein [Acidobacteriota bacterium]